MTPQRPKKKAIQQNDAAVTRWLETDYPAIAKRAKTEKATIFPRKIGSPRRATFPAGVLIRTSSIVSAASQTAEATLTADDCA